MKRDIDAFFQLLRIGLWEQACTNLNLTVHFNNKVNWDEVYKLAEEQSVVGVVLAGIEKLRTTNILETSGTSEHVQVNINQELLLQWIGEVQMLEQQNQAMNSFVAELIEKMRKVDIYTLLLKGQGIAQCYEKPFWRSSGDVDLFLSTENYEKAKQYLLPLASSSDKEYQYENHLGMTIDSWVVELHGQLRCGLSTRIDRVLDEIRDEIIYGGNVRSWTKGNTQVFLLGIDCDIFFIFTHLLKHFYIDGLGLRQVCDWCRLLWSYRASHNQRLLESRLRKARLMSEWKAFGAFAVEYLGMPIESMPFYSPDKKWNRKADKICSFILEVGNMGHNRDMSYFEKYPYLIRKCFSLGRRCGDLIRHARIFPLDSLRFFPSIMFNGLRSAVRGE